MTTVPNDNFIIVQIPGVCFHCGDAANPTVLVEINFEAHLHAECEADADTAYWKAVYTPVSTTEE